MSTQPYDPKFNDRKPFRSDGCSWFPDLWLKECCRSHDYSYWAGHNKLEADLDFLRCIAAQSKRLGPFRFIFAGIIVTGMALGRPIRNLYLRLREKCANLRVMKEQTQHKIQQLSQHADEAVGYGVSGALGSSPVWLGALTGWLELVAVAVAIGVGISTWQLNRIKKKNLEKD